jgi:hypothetical protein
MTATAPGNRAWLWFALILAAAALLAISNESLWIDEMVIAAFGSTGTLEQTWDWMQHVRFREMQAPFYIAWSWCWIHLFGTGEWAMRIANAPWFLAGALVFTRYTGRLTGSPVLAASVVATSAMAWFYLNEARVYAFQLSFALAATGAALEVARSAILTGSPDRGAMRWLAAAFVGLCGSSIMGAVFGSVLFVSLLVSVPVKNWIALVKASPASLLVAGVMLVGLLAYYDWTRTLNLQATQVGTTTPATAVFVFYELAGLGGLGPGRNDLRGSGIGTLLPYAPWLALFAVSAAVVLWGAWTRIRASWDWRRALVIGGMLLALVMMLFAVGMLTRFRVLGRHVIPVLPFVLLLFAIGAAWAWRAGKWRRGVAVLFLALCAASALNIRFAERHRKDDYRAAAEIVRAELAAGHVVWWNADIRAPYHYKFPLAGGTNTGGAFSLQNPPPELLTQLPRPAVILSSKADIYDAGGAVRAYAQTNGYRLVRQLPAFTVWKPGR